MVAFVWVVMQLQFHLKGILGNNKGERKSPGTEWWADVGWLKSPWRQYGLYEAIKQKSAAFPFILSAQRPWFDDRPSSPAP